jgi:hypothetical protein
MIRTGRSGQGSVPISVPPSCLAIIGFAAAGVYQDSITGDQNTQAYLSADLTDSISAINGGLAKGLLAVAGTYFPPIPVSADEALLVLFYAPGSAVIYFESVEI